MPPEPPLMKPNTGSKSTLAATLPHCRGKPGFKHLELATPCDAFQESRGQPGVVARPRPLRTAFWAFVYL
jgi:hypothetical protein